MPIPLTLKSLDEVPEGMRDSYKQEGDKFVLKEVAGFAPKSQVNEFRDNNRQLQTQLDEITTKLGAFEGFDLEEAKANKEAARRIAEKELIDKGDVDTLIEQRMKPVLADRDRKYAELETQYTSANGKLSELLVGDSGLELLVKRGLQTDMIEQGKYLATKDFMVDKGKVQARPDADGQPRYGTDGMSPLSINDEWADSIKQRYPSMFVPAQGSDAPQGGGTRGVGQQDRSKMSSTQKISEGFKEQSA